MKTYFVCILTNHSRRLYTGVTNDLERRVAEHKGKRVPGFSKRYNFHRLVYFEETNDIGAAIAREKQIKGWLRKKKIELIESANPAWKDLSAEPQHRDSSLRSEFPHATNTRRKSVLWSRPQITRESAS